MSPLLLSLVLAPPSAPMAEVRDLKITARSGDLDARLYRPTARRDGPLMVYYHGGGFVMGDIAATDAVCRTLAARSGVAVLSVAYRLAPKDRYPAALEDAYDAYRWAIRARDQGWDPARVAVGGDSAGANLAAGVAVLARDKGERAPAFQLLVNPALDATRYDQKGFESYRELRGLYVARREDDADAHLSVLRTWSITGLPPAFVVVSELDPLRAEGEEFAARLRKARIPVRTFLVKGKDHLGPEWGEMSPAAIPVIEACAEALKAAFPERKRGGRVR